jgi:hypothetical protein
MNQILRPAIAMIELIFAIVVMGLALMSVPMLISTATKSGYVAIQQEAVAEAASNMNIIMGYHWDEQDTSDSAPATVLLVSSLGHIDLNESSAGYRVGTPLESTRSYFDHIGSRFSATPKASLGEDAGDRDDIDDFNGNSHLIEVLSAAVDNIETDTIRISTKVAYIPDAPAGSGYNNTKTIIYNPDFTADTTTSTNIKRITTTLTSVGAPAELSKKIVLHAFSCNIGVSEIESITIP